MQISLTPNLRLTTASKAQVVRWVKMMLDKPDLADNSISYPLSGRLAIYIDGIPVVIVAGQWQKSGQNVYVGHASSVLTNAERLGIIAVIISATDLWEDLLEPYSNAVARSLIEQYNTSMAGLIRSEQPATGLAFNTTTAQMVAQINDKWFLPNGELLEKLDNNWTVIQ